MTMGSGDASFSKVVAIVAAGLEVVPVPVLAGVLGGLKGCLDRCSGLNRLGLQAARRWRRYLLRPCHEPQIPAALPAGIASGHLPLHDQGPLLAPESAPTTSPQRYPSTASALFPSSTKTGRRRKMPPEILVQARVSTGKWSDQDRHTRPLYLAGSSHNR